MIVLDAITKRYGRTLVLDAVSATIERGAITALLGPNGAGKSTLLHVVTGLADPSSGTVRVIAPDGATLDRRSAIGFCPDDLPMPDLLTGGEYLDLVVGIRGIRVAPDVRRALLAGVRLEHAERLPVGAYSHGMRRKLQLVAALLHRPSVLVLDEPLRGLDPESSAVLRGLLRRWADRGNTVLVATHDLFAAERLCDRVLVLDGGVLRADLGMDEVRAGGDADLEARFLALIGSDEVASSTFFAGLDALEASDTRHLLGRRESER